MKKVILLLINFTFFVSVNAQIYSEQDVEICSEKFEYAANNNLAELSVGDIIVEIGKTSLGLDYEAFTLEKGDHEQLVIHLSGLDCYTFFESSLAFARCIKKGETTFKDFQNEIKSLRYRNGIINNYTSRLHYSSDWLYDNARRGIIKDVTKEIGGIEYSKEIDFMSAHSNLYKQLKNNDVNISLMKEIEDSISNRLYYYIPENFIGCIEEKIQNGDIILLTAKTKGLDISHTGIAIKLNDGRIHFMHAPMKGAKVQITKQPLSEYVKEVKNHTGIMVARPIEP